MSQDAVARFLELVAANETLKTAMNAAADEQADVAATAVGLGKTHGIEFTSEEFVSVVEAFHREHSGEIDEAELNGVSGGFTPQPEPPGISDLASDSPWFSQKWATKGFRGR
jgi:predicted ribosomally synthesized peptide with nif11-like leader